MIGFLCAVLALLAAIGLAALSPHEPSRYVLPAVRATALLTVAAAYVAWLFTL